jgi:pilus assembly protein FimV
VAPAPAPVPAPQPQGPSLVSQVLAWVANPILWIGLGVAALLFTALWFVRRRRQEPEDVTGRWEALEAEVEEDVREATTRLRAQAPEESILVEEQTHAPVPRPKRAAPMADLDIGHAAEDETAEPSGDETLSSQTVINLDQADPVAEADFHMAYGLYDQAAELITKALEAAPKRRDLKLKLLEVFFVWGNKESFLAAAQSLRKEIGKGPDADWDKVVIMGKQICPDEKLFTEATTGAAQVDVDLQAGDSPLDLAFDEAQHEGVDLDLSESDDSLDFELEASGALAKPAAPSKPAARKPKAPDLDDSLDIGERTAAGLEAALFMSEHGEDEGSQTTPDLTADSLIDSLAATQESPTVESPRGGAAEPPTAEFVAFDVPETPTVETPTIETEGPESPTMETPTVETTYAGAESPTMETPTVETPYGESPTMEETGAFNVPVTDRTAEIDLDDLGLDIKDLEELPEDLGDLPVALDSETDTREQPALANTEEEDDLLSATGVTQVLHGEEDSLEEDEEDSLGQQATSVLDDDDATLLAPGFDDGTMTGTEVLDSRFAVDDESGDTSLVQQLGGENGLDLNLDDLSAALHGGETVEQPRSSSFGGDIFGGDNDTPVDLDVGSDVLGSDDPTGTEEVSPLDPQTMTEVGTKLDLARAYIDMGDPEGARSILEEVLDEGDPNQRREAQSLIDVLSA